MDFPDPFSGASGGNKPSPRKELQGPRPPALKVNKDSHKIRKPPLHHQAQPVAPPRPQQVEERQPVIIYAVSPKVHHTTVGDFMDLVQRLTGYNTTTPHRRWRRRSRRPLSGSQVGIHRENKSF
ncbi:vq motif-containing protein 8 [Abeliophyllum distichum]|uniref:Vq motif-containing protein 8 n=1 Tax=Abeliophyllum distichum TaxID=126358 RepID=A0ABD1V2I6_9LAMI